MTNSPFQRKLCEASSPRTLYAIASGDELYIQNGRFVLHPVELKSLRVVDVFTG